MMKEEFQRIYRNKYGKEARLTHEEYNTLELVYMYYPGMNDKQTAVDMFPCNSSAPASSPSTIWGFFLP